MTPINCDKASFLLERRWDKALALDEERSLDDHLATCEVCREEAEAIALADVAFLDLESLEPCRNIASAVAEAIVKEAPAEPRRGWFWAAAALLAAAFGAMWTYGVTLHLDWGKVPILYRGFEAGSMLASSAVGWVKPFVQAGTHLAPTAIPVMMGLFVVEIGAAMLWMSRNGRLSGAARRA